MTYRLAKAIAAAIWRVVPARIKEQPDHVLRRLLDTTAMRISNKHN